MGSEAYLVFMAAFRIGAHDLVSLSSRSWDLHPYTAHGAVVGDCLWLLLLYLLYVLYIAQDGLRTGRGPPDLICVRIGVLGYLLRPESELDFDSATLLFLSYWGLARLSLLGGLTLSLRLSLRSSSIGLGPWWPTLGWRSGRWLGWRSGRWRRGGCRGGRGSAWRRRCRFLVCFVSHAISYRRCGCPLKESGGCWIYSCRVGE